MSDVVVAGGRRLSFDVHGQPHGPVVFALHGTPGSRLGMRPSDEAMARHGARVITYDRPGYGGSTRDPGRNVGDAAADVAAIADSLGVHTFAVYGVSGGGPHALACAALLGDRVTRAASVVGIAPFLAEGLNWFAGMTASNVTEFGAALAGEPVLRAALDPAVSAMKENPDALIDELAEELPGPDRDVLGDPRIRDMLRESFAGAVAVGPDGWIDDDVAFGAPWGFDPADIAVPTLVWHGDQDQLAPATHSHWLAGRVPGATFHIAPGAGHMQSFASQDDLLPWLLGTADALS